MGAMTVFHGGPMEIRTPRIIHGRFHKDFGDGFYCTAIRRRRCSDERTRVRAGGRHRGGVLLSRRPSHRRLQWELPLRGPRKHPDRLPYGGRGVGDRHGSLWEKVKFGEAFLFVCQSRLIGVVDEGGAIVLIDSNNYDTITFVIEMYAFS